ncbi:MAG: exodeoxyribonuclease VII small subunit [Nitrospirae bacterium]|nr:exodeoxyribonuclease VII small subunit [Nitrospirota bacterium]
MAEMKFEEALKKLEKIVSDLERGELSLDNSLKKYEEGVRLAKICTKKLEEAEKKVEILVKSEDGKKEKKPFEVLGMEENGKVEKEKIQEPGSKEGELLF